MANRCDHTVWCLRPAISDKKKGRTIEILLDGGSKLEMSTCVGLCARKGC